jgi:hypothetical protein
LLRYFTYVGGALMALLFVASYLFPDAETVAHQDVTRPNIRITTDRVAPPRVDFDTSVQAAVVPTLPPGVMLLQAPPPGSALQARAQLTTICCRGTSQERTQQENGGRKTARSPALRRLSSFRRLSLSIHLSAPALPLDLVGPPPIPVASVPAAAHCR